MVSASTPFTLLVWAGVAFLGVRTALRTFKKYKKGRVEEDESKEDHDVIDLREQVMNYPFFQWIASRFASARAVGSDVSDNISAAASHDNVGKTLVENQKDDSDSTSINDVSDNGMAVASAQEEQMSLDKTFFEKDSDATESAPLDHYYVAEEEDLKSAENYSEVYSSRRSEDDECGNDIQESVTPPEELSPCYNENEILQPQDEERGGSALEADGSLLAPSEVSATSSAVHFFNGFEELQKESSEASTSSTFTMVEVDAAGGFNGEAEGYDEKEINMEEKNDGATVEGTDKDLLSTSVKEAANEQFADFSSTSEVCVENLEATFTKNESFQDNADAEENHCTISDVETDYKFSSLTPSIPDSSDKSFKVMQSADVTNNPKTSSSSASDESCEITETREVVKVCNVVTDDKSPADEIPSSNAENDDVIKQVCNVINTTMQEICESVTDAVKASRDPEILRITSGSAHDKTTTEAVGDPDKIIEVDSVAHQDTESKADQFSDVEPKETLVSVAPVTVDKKKFAEAGEAKEPEKKDADSLLFQPSQKRKVADRPRNEQVAGTEEPNLVFSDGNTKLCCMEVQLKLIHTDSSSADKQAMADDRDTCELSFNIKSVEGLVVKNKAKIYMKIFLLNEKEGMRKRKQKTRTFKHSSSIAVNQTVTFEKIPQKMLNGYLLVSVFSGGGMGGGRQLCKIEIEFKKVFRYGKSQITSLYSQLMKNKSQWVDTTMNLG